MDNKPQFGFILEYVTDIEAAKPASSGEVAKSRGDILARWRIDGDNGSTQDSKFAPYEKFPVFFEETGNFASIL